MSKEKRVGNIGDKEYQECVRYFEMYWKYFVERNPSFKDNEKWMEIIFMVFLSGYSAGINMGEQNKKSLIEEIAESN